MNKQNLFAWNNILITGAQDFIGQEQNGFFFSSLLSLRFITTRDPKKYADEDAQRIKRFLRSWEDDLVEAMNTADAIIHLAGKGIFLIQRWNEE